MNLEKCNYVTKFEKIRKLKPHLLSISPKTSFGKIFRKIKKSKDIEIVWVKKATYSQMAAVLTSRLIGKKFLWIQNFANPPVPNLITRFLLTQTDRIIVISKKDASRLKTFGIEKSKIRLESKS